MKLLISCLTIALIVFLGSTSQAQIPRTLSYQGILADSNGVPKPDGSYSITFRLYDAATGGSALWAEQKTLQVKRGLFASILGDQVLFGTNLQFDRQYWLSIQVAASAELSPRIPLSAVGYSLHSLRADSVEWSGIVNKPSFSAGTVTNISTGSGLSGGPITTSGTISLATGGVDSTKLAPSSVTSTKIVDGAIRGADIANSTIDASKLSFTPGIGSVTSVATGNGLTGGPITSSGTISIATAGIDSAKLAPASVTSTKIADETIRGDDIANSTISAAKLSFLPGTINGSGTVNYMPKFTINSTTLGASVLSENAGNVNVGRIASTTRSRMFVSSDDLPGSTPFYAIRGEDTTHSSGYGGFFMGRWRGLTGNARAAVNDPSSTDYTGVEGIADGRGGTNNTGYGVHSVSANAKFNYGVKGEGQGGTTAYGIYGTATGATTNYGVFGSAPVASANAAGYFSGNLQYTGSLIGPSDSRFKEKLSSIEGIISKLMQLKSYSYEYSTSSEFRDMNFAPGKHFGLIAQEVEKVLPELVTNNVHPAPPSDNKGLQTGHPIQYKGVNYMELIPMLLSALQSQQAQIEKLQMQVNELSNRK
ncbi:MAG: tail fiber domain-containing protein [Ignavibacteriae bacterium]|nr:tail fiber domain-containing protein [Ignavibacteriota bacterium]